MASGPDNAGGSWHLAPGRRGFLRLLCAALAAAVAAGMPWLRRAGGAGNRRASAPADETEARFWRRV